MKRIAFLLLFIFSVSAGLASAQKQTADKLWREIDDAGLQRQLPERRIIPHAYRTFAVDKAALETTLRAAPMEFTADAARGTSIVTLPMPDGSLARFTLEESPVFEAGFAAKHPDFKTYRGHGIDDPTATARFDLLPNGFHAIILSTGGTVLVDPYAANDTRNYISYFKSDAERTGEFFCGFKNTDFTEMPDSLNFLPESPNVVSGTNLRTYRLALAADGEYVNVFRQPGDTDAQAKTRALAEMVLIMNRVNGVYERDVAIHMNMIANETAIIFTDPATDPYTDEDGQAMLAQNQQTLDTIIGTANYDIGHVFSTGGGGIASLRSPCTSTRKAQGVTGLPTPIGDAFAIDYVAHEMGHQFGGNHTFNTGLTSCGAQRSDTASYEPGSGVTIMGYAGICGSQNLAAHSIDTFHVRSIEEIVSFSTGTGNACSVPTATGNTPPDVTVLQPGSTIPKQTPFYLSASATDANGDSLTYDWEEYDLGAPATAVPNSDEDGQVRPILRPFAPTTDNTRIFPRLQFILNNQNRPPNTTGGRLTGEILPSISRQMIFQVVVRDNRANGGGVRSRPAIVDVDGTAGPFIITSPPDTPVSWTGSSAQTVTWNVANTTNATINTQNVKISLSIDGGTTFPYVLSASTPNDGSEAITVPNVNTALGRIKVEAVGNIFFDISGANITITASTTPTRTLFDFDGDGKADISVFRQTGGFWYLQQSQSGFTGTQFGVSTDKIVPADYDGDGKTDVAVYRGGTWYIQRSTLGFTGIAFGDSNDIPVPADYDNDGKADVAVFRPSNGTWYLQQSTAGFTGIAFGANGDKPVAADYDGDGKADVAVVRNGVWYIQRSTLGFLGFAFGDSNDKLVPADYDGDGKADIAVFRPSNGVWYIQQSQAGFTGIAFGVGTDIPTPADYDGDGKADVAVFRSGTWYVQRSQAGFLGFAFGASNDLPVENAYVR